MDGRVIKGRYRKSTPEYREEAVKQVVQTSTPIAEVARGFGINPGTLDNWVNQYRKEHPVSEELSSPDRARLRELEKEARELRLGNAFNKKPQPTSRGRNSKRALRVRVQQELHGHRGRKGDPLYAARRTLHTADLLTEKHHDRLDTLFTGDRHLQVELTWGIYQRMISAYRDPDRAGGRTECAPPSTHSLRACPCRWVELRTLGRTLARRVCDVLAYFERPRTSNGPTEAVIIWSPSQAVPHVIDGLPSPRRRHVI